MSIIILKARDEQFWINSNFSPREWMKSSLLRTAVLQYYYYYEEFCRVNGYQCVCVHQGHNQVNQ